MVIKRLAGALFAVVLVAISSETFAQDSSRFELAGSYQFLQPVCPGVDCFNYPGGWQASVSSRLTTWLSVVGEIGENLKTMSMSVSGPIALTSTTSGTLTSTSSTRLRMYDALVGPRALTRIGRTRVFGELLFGLTRNTFVDANSMSIPEEGAQVRTSLSASFTKWAWQPGLGLDLPLTTRWSTRVGFGYRLLGAVPTQLSHGDLLLETGIMFRPGRIAHP